MRIWPLLHRPIALTIGSAGERRRGLVDVQHGGRAGGGERLVQRGPVVSIDAVADAVGGVDASTQVVAWLLILVRDVLRGIGPAGIFCGRCRAVTVDPGEADRARV